MPKRSAKEVLEYLAERVRRIESETHNVAEVLERMAERLPTPREEPID
jgi:flagellar motor component MotA